MSVGTLGSLSGVGLDVIIIINDITRCATILLDVVVVVVAVVMVVVVVLGGSNFIPTFPPFVTHIVCPADTQPKGSVSAACAPRPPTPTSDG